MALINCVECGNQVSDTAAACPKCGASPGAAKKSQSILQKPIGCGTLLLFLFVVWVFWPSAPKVQSPPKTPEQLAQEKAANQEELLAKCEHVAFGVEHGFKMRNMGHTYEQAMARLRDMNSSIRLDPLVGPEVQRVLTKNWTQNSLSPAEAAKTARMSCRIAMKK